MKPFPPLFRAGEIVFADSFELNTVSRGFYRLHGAPVGTFLVKRKPVGEMWLCRPVVPLDGSGKRPFALGYFERKNSVLTPAVLALVSGRDLLVSIAGEIPVLVASLN